MISIRNISKEYSLTKAAPSSFGQIFKSFSKSPSDTKETFKALDDVSFDVERGEIVGIIGNNGAGKSTLLKVLSKITSPSAGEIHVRGRLASLLEVGTGFHAELSGMENIFLNGTILGMTRQEIKSKLDEIIDFAGVEKFINTPVKHYSSGMYVRLAFSVAAHLEPEILVVDEVLAVGDFEFQKKCLGKMKEVSSSQGRTILFVSHNLATLKALCTRGVLMQGGKKIFDANINDTINEYVSTSYNSDQLKELLKDKRQHVGSLKILVTKINLLVNNAERTVCQVGDDMEFRLYYDINDSHFDFTGIHFSAIITNDDHLNICAHTSKIIGVVIKNEDVRHSDYIKFTIKKFPFKAGKYHFSYDIVDQVDFLDKVENAFSFVAESGLVYNYIAPITSGIGAINADWELA
jgi:lipopolysaccharide transport system ATP-binding protein